MSISPLSRRQLPVYSPLPFGAVASGIRASISDGQSALDSVRTTLEEYYGPVDLLLTDSGTTALTLALRAARSWRGDLPVALPGYSCFDVATAAAGARAPVRLYDVDPRTLAPDLASLRQTLRKGVAAVVVAHLYGLPVDLRAVLDVARETGTPVIEDAAQAAGGEYGGRRLGSFGAFSVLSFGRGKGTTGCGGGALLAHGNAPERWLPSARSTIEGRSWRGWSRAVGLLGQWLFGRPGLYRLPSILPFLELGETVYREPEPVRPMSALSAGTLRRTLEHQPGELEQRRRSAARYRQWMTVTRGVTTIQRPSGGEPGYLRFPFRADPELAASLRSGEARSLGIMPGYPKSLEELDALRNRCQNLSTPRPGAAELARGLFTLPTHSRVTEDDLLRIRSFVEESGRRRSPGPAPASPAQP